VASCTPKVATYRKTKDIERVTLYNKSKSVAWLWIKNKMGALKMLRVKSPKNGNKIMLALTFWLVLVMLSLRLDLFYHVGIEISDLWRTVYIQFASFVIPFAVYLVITKQKVKNVLRLDCPSIKNIIFAILLGVAIVPIGMGGLALGNALNEFIFGSEYTIAMQQVAPSLWALLLVGALLPSIAEEIWFRGVLFNFYHRYITIGKIALITGLFFGLMHGIPQFLYTFIAGVIWAYALYYTRSIWIPVISHFVANALSHTMGFLMETTNGSTYGYHYAQDGIEANPLVYYLIFFCILGIVSALMIFICMRVFKKHHRLAQPSTETDINTNKTATEKSKVFTWEFAVAVVVWIVFGLLSGFGFW